MFYTRMQISSTIRASRVCFNEFSEYLIPKAIKSTDSNELTGYFELPTQSATEFT